MADKTKPTFEEVAGDGGLYPDYGGDRGRAQAMIDDASNITDAVYSDLIRTRGEIRGPVKTFKKHLAAHLLVLSDGGEIGSNSQTNHSVTFSHLQMTGDAALAETRFGRTCLMMLDENQSIGVEKTY